jgi:hypothetical protein
MTAHALERCDHRQVSTSDVHRVLIEGEVVEDYPATRPFPSCLMQLTLAEDVLYAVCALGDGFVHVITVHWLDPAKWLDPRTRRERR